MRNALVATVCLCLLLAVNARANDPENGVDGDRITVIVENNSAQQQLQGASDSGTTESKVKGITSMQMPGSGLHIAPTNSGLTGKRNDRKRRTVYSDQELIHSMDEFNDYLKKYGITFQPGCLFSEQLDHQIEGGEANEIEPEDQLPDDTLLEFSLIIPGDYRIGKALGSSYAKMKTGNGVVYYTKQELPAAYNRGRTAGTTIAGSHVGDAASLVGVNLSGGNGKAVAIAEYLVSFYVFRPEEKITSNKPLFWFPVGKNFNDQDGKMIAEKLYEKWDKTSPLLITLTSDDSSAPEKAKYIAQNIFQGLMLLGISDKTLMEKLRYEANLIKPVEIDKFPGAIGIVSIKMQ